MTSQRIEPAPERIGVISDTHGLLRPEAEAALRGCSRLLHAGDIGRREVLEQLGRIAPVIAVRGNADTAPWAASLPEEARVTLGGRSIFIRHDRNRIDPDVLAGGVDVMITGHSHVPKIEERDGILFVNPGSAGPRRFRLPVSLAILHVTPDRLEARLIELLPAAGA